jgi:hypothetical protein
MNWGPAAWRNSVDERQGLDTLNALIEAARLPPAEGLKRAEIISRESLPENQGKSAYLMTFVSNTFAPSLCHSLEAQARDTSMLNCASAGIALLRYHQDKGALPGSLGELVPQYLEAIPADCMDGQPLRYLFDDGGFTVYSIGPNRKDDGGQAPEIEDRILNPNEFMGQKSRILDSDDITFTVRLRANAGT